LTDFNSRYSGLEIQPDEKMDIIFYVLMFRVKMGRFPTMAEVKDWWKDR